MYADILERQGFRVRRQEPWVHVGDATRVQGWKLHVSSIPTQASHVLQTILPALRTAGVAFKVILDDALLSQLNEGNLGTTQIGKFATIYPSSDAAARRLATELVELTRGFAGPVVATDLRLGDVVYSRYGAFRPIIVRDRLGRQASYVRDPAGGLQRDEYAIPFSVPRGRKNPFNTLLAGFTSSQARRSRRNRTLLGPGFLILDVLKAHPKGSVYRGLDLRDRDRMAIWVVKEGRQWCLSDRHGRDMRTRLRHQAHVHAELQGRAPVPDAGEYFEVDGNGYLPVAFIRGRSLVQVASDDRRERPWHALGAGRQRAMLEHLLGAIKGVDQMHRAGYVHRDLSGGNVLAGDDGRVWLIDLELVHALDDDAPPFGLGTPGFMSPDQEARRPVTPADDVYALGALTLLLLTGLDPRRLLFAAPADRHEQWHALARGAHPGLVELVTRCLDARAGCRPTLDEMRATVADAAEAPTARSGPHRIRRDSSLGAGLEGQVRRGLRGLARDSPIDESSGLWLSEAFDRHDIAVVEGRRRLELRRSANRGIAGVLFVLGRLARCGYRTRATDARARRAATWLVGESSAPDSGMPGLHFGEAGVAVALVEAIAGGIVAPSPEIARFVRKALAGALDWPDLTHGAAGQGIAALYCGDRMADPAISAFADRCADFLITTQRPGGHWAWPSGLSAPRDVYTGFAHGVAGVTYFIAEYARRTGVASAERAWRRGANWLMARSDRQGNALSWPNSTGRPDRWVWWCHGSVGIAVLFLRLYEQTGESRYADVAQRALSVHPPDFLAVNLSQCHGSSGVGEVYIEASRVLGGRRWKRRAESVLDVLWALRRGSKTGAAAWLVESTYGPTADLMVGCSGIVHLFLRASLPPTPLGLPLLLDPL